MGKTCKVIVAGSKSVGKTALVEQLIYGQHVVGTPMFPTIEDIYISQIDTDRNVREKIQFYDTAGLDHQNPELSRHYIGYADGCVLVYDITSFESFKAVCQVKKDIDKYKEKKEVTILVLGNKIDCLGNGVERQVDMETAQKWSQSQKVKLFEVTVCNRASLMEPFMWMASKMTQPPAKSGFPLGRRNKQSSAQDN